MFLLAQLPSGKYKLGVAVEHKIIDLINEEKLDSMLMTIEKLISEARASSFLEVSNYKSKARRSLVKDGH